MHCDPFEGRKKNLSQKMIFAKLDEINNVLHFHVDFCKYLQHTHSSDKFICQNLCSGLPNLSSVCCNLWSCLGYYQRKSFRFSPEEPDSRRIALESAQYPSQGHHPSSFLC